MNLPPWTKGKKFFIFDMDGTIANLEQINHGGHFKTVKEFFNLNLSNIDYQKYFAGTRTKEALEGFLHSRGIYNFDTDDLIKYFRKNKRDYLSQDLQRYVKPKPGMKQFLKYLKNNNFKTCLATSTIKEFTEVILQGLGVIDLFDIVITSEDVQKGKPDPEIYTISCEKLGGNLKQSIVFEDSKNGITAAKNAGIFCVGILTRGLNDGYLTQADIVIENYLF